MKRSGTTRGQRGWRRTAALLAAAGLGFSLALRAAAAADAGTAMLPVPAAENPFVVPQHDVDILYEVPPPAGTPAGAGALMTQRVRFAAAVQKQRVDPPGNASFMITDYPARRLTMVETGRRMATTVPAPGGALSPPGSRATGSFRRGNTLQVAGYPCTEWLTADDSGAPSVLCLTADGVMLQARQGDRVLIRARTVRYGPLDADVFAVPAGYATGTPPRPEAPLNPGAAPAAPN
ncbi:hypothetical protein [Rhizosaccharibacter radicis]|uniref:DUF4412 domain-containing protein n=1 Tax=Rhizosaccharibacter radicis TaxID=2782605 RepID=A0ABT1VXQ1_9PROT|nr:hypothetical protein [Acetobacteraceae bacterium KSS12]